VAEAEAKAINMRADALSEGNQALIAANKLIEMLPSLVAAAAEGIKGSNLTVLNGSDGVNEVLTGVVAQGLTIYDTLRKSVGATSANVNADAGGASDTALRTEVANGSSPEHQDAQKS
jgi:flotillin